MKLRLLIELDSVTKRWSAVFPELPGCASAGDTEAEAIANAKEALALWFEPSPLKLGKDSKLVELALPGAGGIQSATQRKSSKFCACMDFSVSPSRVATKSGGTETAGR